ncbi:DUF305 domain-containing protein [Streptomyces sp. JH34]|uniref:DUF305 domain-containing protein n=1 Tax=Streptomyces sp. JH34 TaxID=2793633 RepID=UPI0023F9FB8A|nr:DUF305 domain-containing protein [Streptomyces sp. JH34]MDF6017779.1 DUF305 domain-containing protein [Streptomyces sp. JH34]
MPARLTASILLLLTALSACAREGDSGSVPSATAVAPAPSANPTDSAWIQLMIPMDQQAVALLDLAAEKATGPRLRAWAARLRTDQAAELTELRGLRTRMGLPDTDLHEGHDMPGMVTAGDLASARASEGAAFDRLLVAQIQDHLRQSQQVSRSETTAGSGAEATARARELVTARGRQLASLTSLCAGRAADVPEPFACHSDHPV